MGIGGFGFATATSVRFGRGAARLAAEQIAKKNAPVMLVTGANPSRADWLAAELKGQGCAVTSLAVDGEPDVATVLRGVELARDCGVTMVVAHGGGAALDAGKAVAALCLAQCPIEDHLEVVGKGLALESDPLPFFAFATTAGTGAEVTCNSVIFVPGHQRKVSLRDPRMLADIAVADPSLTDGCPRSVTLASGLDAITQVIEPYICARANVLTDSLCRDAIPKGLAALARLMAAEDRDARDTMAWVSLCGGLALSNAGLGVVHALAGPLGGLAGVSHGVLCGALLPHGLAANQAKATDAALRSKLEEVQGWVAQALGGRPEDAFGQLASWSRRQGLPSLGELGVSAQIRQQAAQAAGSSSSMRANPVTLDADELGQIVEAAVST